MNNAQLINDDYRQYYKDYYAIEFSGDYVIHHIDLDHSNNDIDNLLLIPRDLHTAYHTNLRICEYDDSHFIDGLVRELDTTKLKAIKKLSNIFREIYKWKLYKEYDYSAQMKRLIFDELDF